MEIVITLLFGLFAGWHVSSFFLRSKAIQSYQSIENIYAPKITIVVCAHNEKGNLVELLPLLQNQQYQNFEIIIALDRCTDGSAELLKSFSDHRVRLLEIVNCSADIHPKKYAIHSAIALAEGEWILLTDADCRPKPNWAQAMSNGMLSTKDVVLGLSPYQKRAGILNSLIQYETFVTAQTFVASTLLGKPYMGLGRNLAYRKKTFLDSGGFGSTASITGGDDDLLVQRLVKNDNCAVVFSSDAFVDSIPKENWRAYFHQKTRHYSVGHHYPAGVKKLEVIRWSVHLLLWLLFLACSLINLPISFAILAVAMALKAISINIVADRLEKRFNYLWLPFVDLLYVVIFPLLSLRSLLVKRIAWN